jgi:hypothetical protein
MNTFHSVFDEVHDVAIFGGGYAGFAAARTLLAAGKSVLLIDRRAALLMESGWSFQTASGGGGGDDWRSWRRDMGMRGVADAEHCDGALSEVLATHWARHHQRSGKLKLLYYATPLALEGEDHLCGVLLGTKRGLQRVVARQWIDATHTGELAQLLARSQGREWQTPTPVRRAVYLYFRHADWPHLPMGMLSQQGVKGAHLRWATTLWPNERCLTIELEGTGDEYGPNLRGAWIPALRALHATFPDAMREAILTHGSVEPVSLFAEGASSLQGMPQNVALALPWQRQYSFEDVLAQRFEIGEVAAQQLLDAPAARATIRADFEGDIRWREQQCDIAVAGLGTGGAVATLATARRSGGNGVTLGFDPLPFCGGIGAGGGIHWYYFGVKGGLQEELDARQREVLPLFGGKGQIFGFHPDAKKCVLETLLNEAGAQLLFGATLLEVERNAGRVRSALLATPEGPLRVSASAWIDGTGDGDLATRAGAAARIGRDGDGLLHAYSQSSGRAGIKDEKSFLQVVNYDAGFVDATDSEDLTRARLEGISYYESEEYSALDRPTYIAPAIGLRQSRHILTDYTLELSDLIENRQFEDAVGLTGCHYDNHAFDYEFESDEALLWVWVCRQWRGRTGCQIPYRVLLPQGVDNVWLACRALGVSQDAHHSLRMQRDMQRIGEVAGIAATLAPQGESRRVKFEALRVALMESGALAIEARDGDDFGPDTKSDRLAEHIPADVATWLEELQTVAAQEAFSAPWNLYRAGEKSTIVREEVLALLSSTNDIASWRAAAIGALWGEAAVAPRLLHSIRERDGVIESNGGVDWRSEVPLWLISISLLRSVGAPDCLPLLDDLAAEASLLHNARTAIALCCEGIASRHVLNDEQREAMLRILWRLIESPAPNSVAPPQRALTQTEFAPGMVMEDWTWQVHLAVARARRALGLPPHEQALAFQQDERGLVRQAFELVATELPLESGLIPVGI